MCARVQPRVKAWEKFEPERLVRELESHANLLVQEARRIKTAVSRQTWSLDTHNDPGLEMLGNTIWRLGEKIRRGEKIVYLSVVKDVPVAGRRPKVKTLRSFGRRTVESQIQANHFAQTYDAAVEYRRKLGTRRLRDDEARAMRNTYGRVLGPELIDDVIEGRDGVLPGDGHPLEWFASEGEEEE